MRSSYARWTSTMSSSGMLRSRSWLYSWRFVWATRISAQYHPTSAIRQAPRLGCCAAPVGLHARGPPAVAAPRHDLHHEAAAGQPSDGDGAEVAATAARRQLAVDVHGHAHDALAARVAQPERGAATARAGHGGRGGNAARAADAQQPHAHPLRM